jgi:LacI family transcriptional regulator
MAARIKDIAKIAEVSPTAVSLALNNKAGVSDETRSRVLQIASELRYQPPKGSAQLAVESICFLHIARHGHTVNRDHDVFIADYIAGLSEGATQVGLSLEVLTFTSTPIESIIESARAHDAAGIVVLGTELTEEDVQAFSEVRTPLVFIDTYHDFLQFDFVDMNNADCVFAIIEHFASRGHRQIGMVKGAIETRNIRLREEGFKESLARHGLSFDPALLFSVDATFYGAYEEMAALLRGGAKLPSALFCANDIIACGCLKAFGEAGIRVPEDVSMIGFDDLPLAAHADPPLTTIEVSKAHMGRLAVQLLTNHIRTPSQAPPVKILVGGRLVVRRSVMDFGGNA